MCKLFELRIVTKSYISSLGQIELFNLLLRIIIIIIIYPLEFFTSALADGLSLKTE